MARSAVEAAWRRNFTSGVAAFDGDRLIGYLFADLAVDPQFLRSVWIRAAGHALSPDYSTELYRDLYAAAGPEWLALGAFEHFVLAPATEAEILDAFFRLGFGHQQAYGLLDLQEWSPHGDELIEGLEVRQAQPADRAVLVGFAELIHRYQAGPPVWGPALPENRAELREGFAELVDDEDAVVFLAFLDGHPAAYQAYFHAEAGETDILVPKGCVELKVAGTVSDLRGAGVGRILTDYGLDWCRAAEYRYCLVDWRVTNLLASRFWPRQGFNPVYYRLHRHIDPRVMWAR